jgi:general secretion pathway protein G
MLAKIRQAVRNENGFTLIELLMVIVILGILSGIVVFAVGGITNKGDIAACKADLSTVATAEEAFYAQTGHYATTIAEMVPGFLHSDPGTVAIGTDGAVSGKDTATRKCAAVTL